MTVPFRTPLVSDKRYLYSEIVTATLIRMGVISYNETPTDNMFTICYDIILDTSIQLINSGTIGTFKTRHVKVDENEYKAKPWDHVYLSGDDLSTSMRKVKLPVHYRDIKGTNRYTQDMDCIKVTCGDGSFLFLMFNGNTKQWMNINQPIFTADTVPFSTVDREGYIADLYIKLSDIFGVTDIPQSILDAKERWFQQIQLRAGTERDADVSYLFGTTSDPDYIDPYSQYIYLDYGWPIGGIGLS